MTHEGRMARGKSNIDKHILPNNSDTKYYLANQKTLKTKTEEKKSGSDK